MNILKFFNQPLDQFDLFLINFINQQPFFSIFIKNILQNLSFKDNIVFNLTIYLFLIFFFIFILTNKILMKKLKIISFSI